MGPRDSFGVNAFIAVLDVLACELEKRTNAYAEMNSRFRFLRRLPNMTINEATMYTSLIQNNMKDTFPNTEVVLRIYLSLMVSNCSGERSLSKLNLIKNHLRTMSQQRLVSLSILLLEQDILKSLKIDEVLSTFASKKMRKKCI